MKFIQFQEAFITGYQAIGMACNRCPQNWQIVLVVERLLGNEVIGDSYRLEAAKQRR